MRRFNGLVKKEYWYYRQATAIAAVLILLAISVLPVLLHMYQPKFEVEESRMHLVTLSVIAAHMYSLCLCIASLRRDMKQSDVWLHNPASMMMLVLAKVVYHVLSFIVLISIAYSGLYFIGERLEGTVAEMFVLYIVWVYMLALFFMILMVVTLFFYTLGKQLKSFLGKWSIVLVAIAGWLFIRMLAKMPENFLPYGRVPFSKVGDYLPNLSTDVLTIFVYDIYIAEELVALLVLVLVFVGSCKWLERVITK